MAEVTSRTRFTNTSSQAVFTCAELASWTSHRTSGAGGATAAFTATHLMGAIAENQKCQVAFVASRVRPAFIGKLAAGEVARVET